MQILHSTVTGTFEITHISDPVMTTYNNAPSRFIRGYVATYFTMKGSDQKKAFVSIQFVADGAIADEIVSLRLSKGDVVEVSGSLSQKKETRFKDDKGQDVFFPTIRVEKMVRVDEYNSDPRPIPPKQNNYYKPYNPVPRKNPPPATTVNVEDIDADDLPF